VPPTTVRAIAAGRLAHAVAEFARTETSRDDERWTNEGGSAGAEVGAAPLRAIAARR
jgi:hypothetical protein